MRLAIALLVVTLSVHPTLAHQDDIVTVSGNCDPWYANENVAFVAVLLGALFTYCVGFAFGRWSRP